MRVQRGLAVLVALVCTPFVVGAAQGPAQKCTDKQHPANRGAVQSAPAPGQAKKVCDQPAPPLPPPPPSDEEPTGSEISGSAFGDLDMSFTWSTGETGLQGWTITLSGPVSGSTVTDANGAYSFVGLPAGTYLVCEAPQIGWWQTVPMDGAQCSSGMAGYTRVLSDTPTRFIGNDFGNWLIQ